MQIDNANELNANFELPGEQYASFDMKRNCLVINADSMTMDDADVNGLIEFAHEMGTKPHHNPNLAITVDLSKCLNTILDGNVGDDGLVEPLLIPELEAMKAQLVAALNAINAVLPSMAHSN